MRNFSSASLTTISKFTVYTHTANHSYLKVVYSIILPFAYSEFTLHTQDLL